MSSAARLISTDTHFSYGYHSIFKNLTLTVATSDVCAITGPNGSGKSTLLKLFSGIFRPVSGSVKLYINEKELPREKWYKQLSIATPYTDVIETFTPLELISFYSKFKPEHPEQPYKILLKSAGLENFRHKIIRQFSSGMIQRIRLILALGADTPVLLLDEPTSNLDDAGRDWLYSLLQQQSKHKLTIIATNDAEDIKQCNKRIDIMDFK